MKTFYTLVPLALLAVMISAADAPSPAPQNPPENRGPATPEVRGEKNGGNLPQSGDANLMYRQRMATGKVTDMKEAEITVEGKTETHLLAKLSTFGDRSIVVDLGPRAGLKSEIKNGDEIAAFGTVGRLNERPLIVASKIATIIPIEGRQDIYESIPANYEQSNASNSDRSLARDALQSSNAQQNGQPTYVQEGQPTYVRSEQPPAFLQERLARMERSDCCCR